MKMQKVKQIKEVIGQCISENCSHCGLELVRVEDIWVGKDDDLYYCLDCKDYHKINVVPCDDIN